MKESKGRIEDSPQYWTSKLKAEPDFKFMKDLQIVLRGESMQWLQSTLYTPWSLINLPKVLLKLVDFRVC
jgi:hypothetical protein